MPQTTSVPQAPCCSTRQAPSDLPALAALRWMCVSAGPPRESPLAAGAAATPAARTRLLVAAGVASAARPPSAALTCPGWRSAWVLCNARARARARARAAAAAAAAAEGSMRRAASLLPPNETPNCFIRSSQRQRLQNLPRGRQVASCRGRTVCLRTPLTVNLTVCLRFASGIPKCLASADVLPVDHCHRSAGWPHNPAPAML